MNPELLHLMRCPACGGEKLVPDPGPARGENALLGSSENRTEGEAPRSFSRSRADAPECRITCTYCGRKYQVREGIADFLVDPSPEVVRERNAFRSFRPGTPSKEEEWKEHRETILALPILEGRNLPPQDLKTWRRHGREAFGICAGLDWKGRRVLELGAGRCWLSAHLARQGAKVVAVDILEDEVMGLGCGRFFEEEGVHFERVLCDMHRLPFRNAAFDAVTATAALHHSPRLAELLAEVRRVLKPEGVLLAANEPLYVPWREIPEEERKGAHERTYSLWAWIRLLRKAGFRLTEVRAAEGLVASLAFRAVKDDVPSDRVPGLLPGMLRYGLLLALSPLQALRRKAKTWATGRPMLPLPARKVAYLRARLAGAGLEKEARAENPAHWGPGWYPPEQPEGEERPFRWSSPRSRLLMPSPRGAKVLVLELATFHPSPRSEPAEVELRVGRKKLGKLRIEDHGWAIYRVPAPGDRENGPVPVVLLVRRGYFRPSEKGLGGDARLLGIACRTARWERA